MLAGQRRQHNKQQQLAPAGGRAGKRRSRASKRAPTTYISTDPANFRIMVQQITGVQAADIEMLLQPTETAGIDAATAAVLMAADASASCAMVGAYGGNSLQMPVAGGGDPEPEAAIIDHHQQQPCFPTLDSSWDVMYERSELL